MMNQNKFMLGIFALLLVVGFASANEISISSLTVNPSTVYTLNENTATVTFNVQYKDLTEENKTITVSGSSNVTGIVFDSKTIYLNGTSNQSKSVSLIISNLSNLATQIATLTVTAANASATDSESTNLSLIKSSSSDPHNICGLKYNSSVIEIRSVDDEELDNEDSWDWRPIDNVEISVKVENSADEDLEYDVELFFFDSNSDISDEIATDEDDLVVEGLDIDEGDSETATFTFQIDGEVEEGSYDLYAKVLDEEGRCYVEKVESVDVNKESKQVVVKDVEAENTASCGEQVQVTATVSNVGSQDEDQVKVILYNRELGLNMFKEISDLDEGDSEQVVFNFAVPNNAPERVYKLIFSTEFDYDDDDESYDEQSESEDDYSFSFSVLGNCADSTKPTISAKLTSDVEVGKEMTVEVSVKNNGESQISTMIAVNGYDAWASLESINSSVLTLAKGETKTSTITFVPSKAGQQTFELTLVYNGKTITQPVTVNVSEKSGVFSSLFGNSSKNVSTYLITGIIVLVILIVVVLVLKAILSRKE